MINAKQLQNSYNRLYKCLREYIWPSYIISYIADLEIETYKAFPDLECVRDSYNKLKFNCFKYIDDDEYMKEAFEDFREVLDSSSTLYSKLNSREEVA